MRLALGSLESPVIVDFEAGKGSIEHFPPRNDHDVEACSAVGSAKYFTGEALGAVPLDGCPDLPGGGDAQPGRPVACQHKQGHEPAVNPNTLLVDPLEFGPVADALGGRQRLAAHGSSPASELPLVRDSEPLATLCPATLEDNSPVLCRHSDQEAVGLLTAPGIGLVGALSLHARLCRPAGRMGQPLCVPLIRAEFSILVAGCRGVKRIRTCYSQCATVPGPARRLGWPTIVAFGVFPKISTPVEKTVEKPAVPAELK